MEQSDKEVSAICAASGALICDGCKGPLYVCAPAKNIACKKTFCHECGYTHKAECSTDGKPLCTKELLNRQNTLR